MANCVDPDQTVCSESTLFASIHNSSIMLCNYLQQTTSADDIFRCIVSWRVKGYTLNYTKYRNRRHGSLLQETN